MEWSPAYVRNHQVRSYRANWYNKKYTLPYKFRVFMYPHPPLPGLYI